MLAQAQWNTLISELESGNPVEMVSSLSTVTGVCLKVVTTPQGVVCGRVSLVEYVTLCFWYVSFHRFCGRFENFRLPCPSLISVIEAF